MIKRWYLLVSLAVAGCHASSTEVNPQKTGLDSKQSAGESHIDEPAHAELARRVRLSPDVVARAAIRTETVRRKLLPITVALPGEIVADPDRSARISAPVAGRIEEVRFKEGSLVKQGQVLAVLRVPDLGQLRASYASSVGKARAARTNAERLKDLSAQRLAAEQAYVDALAVADALDLEAQAAREQLTAMGADWDKGAPSRLALRAPISGTVVSRNAVVGQPVTTDQGIGDIVDLSEVWFLGRVFEKDLHSLKRNARAEIQLNAFPKQRFNGSVEYVGRQVDPNARTLTARIRLQNQDDRLSVGLFGTAFVSSPEEHVRDPVLVVARGALTEIAGKTAVFVRHADGDFELHEVVVGDSAAGEVQIVSGLREGEQVVVEGAFTLKSSVLKSAIAEED